MASLVKKYLPSLVGIFLLGAAANLISLSYPILIQHLIDGVTAGKHASSATHLIGLVVALALAGAVIMILRDFFATFLSGKVDRETSQLILSKIVNIPLAQARARSSGQWLVAMQQIQELKLAVGILGTQALFDAMLVIGYVGILAHYDLVASAIYVAVTVATLLGLSAVSQTMYRATDEGFEQKARSETYLTEALRSPLLIRAFQLGDWVQRRWQKPYAESVRRFQTSDYLSALLGAFFQVIRQAAPLFILAWKLPEVSRGHLSIGSVFALSTVFGLGFDPLLKISAMISQYQKILYGYRTVREIFSAKDESGVNERAAESAVGGADVRFENVSFSYDTTATEAPTLSSIDLVARPGEKIALVGHSGAGKTTLLQLLLRLHETSSGRILLDGQPISGLPIGALRAQIGVVAQDTELFTGSILENIALSTATPDLARATECAALANATSFISQLPDGFDTQVGEGGSRLSAGQKQRLSLARALYRNPRLILLDEPTSALDAITEREIAATLPQIASGRTLLMSAHRLASITNFDRIYVIDAGAIVEAGTHDELLVRHGYYHRLWNARPRLKSPAGESHELQT